MGHIALLMLIVAGGPSAQTPSAVNYLKRWAQVVKDAGIRID